MTARQQIIAKLDEPIEGRPARLFGRDTITDDTHAVAVWHDHMDFHRYTHLSGAGSVQEAFGLLNGLATDIEGHDIAPVGVLDLDADTVELALITPAMAPGQRTPLSELHLSN